MVLQIWRSFRALPLWVQIWVGAILVPVNMLAALFWQEQGGMLVAVLAIGGMTPNLFIMIGERGLSKMMAWPHLFIWTPLVIILAMMLDKGMPGGLFQTFVVLLLITDVISLAFDYPDAVKWWRGDRKIAGS